MKVKIDYKLKDRLTNPSEFSNKNDEDIMEISVKQKVKVMK